MAKEESSKLRAGIEMKASGYACASCGALCADSRGERPQVVGAAQHAAVEEQGCVLSEKIESAMQRAHQGACLNACAKLCPRRYKAWLAAATTPPLVRKPCAMPSKHSYSTGTPAATSRSE